ncbi:MAG: TRAP transporter large permease subunit, partial [Mailhella sp.]|nr:TRAP transporter large permease subunit [Mailhella sp.]
IPGFVMTTSMCITAYIIAKKRGYKGTGIKFSLTELLKSIWRGKWALATPVIILGGIYGGIFTPTEAAEVGVIWTLFVGLFIYRKLTWKNISSALIRTSAFAGSATILVGVSMAFSRLLTLYQIPQTVGAFMSSISTNPSVTLLLIALFIFLCGFVADTLAMVVVLAPVFLPITNALGIHPIQLGILFVVCCETGFLTPPFGANLFITMKITNVKLEEVALHSLPYLLTIWAIIFITALFPQFVMFLPELLL